MFLERVFSFFGVTFGSFSYCRLNTFFWLWVICGRVYIVGRFRGRVGRVGGFESIFFICLVAGF